MAARNCLLSVVRVSSRSHFNAERFQFKNILKLQAYENITTYFRQLKDSSALWLQTVGKKSNYPRLRCSKNYLITSLAISMAYAQSDSVEASEANKAHIQDADKLYDSNKVTELYKFLSQFKDSDDAELLWRFARAGRDCAQEPGISSEAKKQLVYEAFQAAEKALGLDANSFACNKWIGIMLSEIGDYEGTKTKIENSFKIRDHFLKAIELNPADPTSRYLLGVWFFTFADLPWYQKKLAAAVFASPPNCTYEQAVEHFLHAETIEPGFYTANQLMLAKTYSRLGQKESARKWINQLLTYPPTTKEDNENIAEAEKLLKSL